MYEPKLWVPSLRPALADEVFERAEGDDLEELKKLGVTFFVAF